MTGTDNQDDSVAGKSEEGDKGSEDGDKGVLTFPQRLVSILAFVQQPASCSSFDMLL
jgi:hypothetical protein